MSIRASIRNLVCASRKSSRRGHSAAHRHTFRPMLESLETRDCPSSVVATVTETLLPFSSPQPGTILDTNGNGTGFTTRLPGTGGSLPTNDPYLQLASGSLLITSTLTDLNYGGVDLGIAEAPGLLLPGVGQNDLTISTLVRGIHVP